MSEKAFIEKYGTYLEASLKSPHIYSIIMEDSQFRIEFKDGKLFRVDKIIKSPGGKGLNVSKVLKQLGADITASGILGGKNGNG